MRFFTTNGISKMLAAVAIFATAFSASAATSSYVDYASEKGVTASAEYTFGKKYVDYQIPELAGTTVKRVLANMDYLYILAHNASSEPVLVVFNHKTKTTVRTLDYTNATGTVKVNDIALTADGYLVGVNYATQAWASSGSGNVRLYYWDKDGEGLPTGEAIVMGSSFANANWNNAYVSQTVEYEGTLDNGMMYFTAETTGDTKAFRIILCPIVDKAMNMPVQNTSRDNLNTVSGYTHLDMGDYLLFKNPYETGSYIFNGTKMGAFLVKGGAAGAANTPTVIDNLSAAVPVQANHTPIFRYGGKIYMAAPEFEGDGNVGVGLYDITTSLAAAEKVTTEKTGLDKMTSDVNLAAACSQYICNASDEVVDVTMALFIVRGDGLITKFRTPTTFTEFDSEEDAVEVVHNKLYVAANWGAENNWNPEAAVEMARSATGVYSITLPAGVNEFKLSTKLGDWDTFNTGLYIADSHMTVGDCRGSKYYALHEGVYDPAKGNIHLAEAPAGQAWNVYVNLDEMKIWAELPLQLYLRGAMNSWESVAEWQLESADGVNFSLSGISIADDQEWKIAEGSAEWPKYFDNPSGEKDSWTGWERNNFGGLNPLKANRSRTMVDNAGNCRMDVSVSDATLNFNLETKAVNVTYVTEAIGSAYSYDHTFTITGEDKVIVSFKSTAAASGRVVLTASDLPGGGAMAAPGKVSRAASYDSGTIAIVKGLNEYTFNVDDLQTNAKYNIAVEFDQVENNEYGLIASYGAGDSSSLRGGVTVMKDPESPLYGRMLTANGYANGLWIIDPDESVEIKKFCVGDANPFLSAQRDSPFKISSYKDKVYVCDNTNLHGGVYMWDPSQAEPEITTVYPEGATYETPKWSIDETQVGARSSTFKVVEREGKDIAYNFWYMYGYTPQRAIAIYELDANGKVAGAPETTYSGARMDNLVVEFWPSNHGGFWEIQVREPNNNGSTCPGFAYVNSEGEITATSAVLGAMGTQSAIALNEDESLLFYATYDYKIGVCDVEWSAEGVPTITFNRFISDSYLNKGYWQFDFDLAGNLVAWGNGSVVKVFAVEHKARTVKVDAPSSVSFTVSAEGEVTSVQDMVADDVEAVYYNLNGQRVAADNLRSGIYIRVAGSKASKVFVK